MGYPQAVIIGAALIAAAIYFTNGSPVADAQPPPSNEPGVLVAPEEKPTFKPAGKKYAFKPETAEARKFTRYLHSLECQIALLDLVRANGVMDVVARYCDARQRLIDEAKIPRQ